MSADTQPSRRGRCDPLRVRLRPHDVSRRRRDAGDRVLPGALLPGARRAAPGGGGTCRFGHRPARRRRVPQPAAGDQAIYDVRDGRDIPQRWLPSVSSNRWASDSSSFRLYRRRSSLCGWRWGFASGDAPPAGGPPAGRSKSARAAFDEVRATDATDLQARRAGFARLDALIRQHLADVCGVAAAGMTPEEIAVALEPCGLADPHRARGVRPRVVRARALCEPRPAPVPGRVARGSGTGRTAPGAGPVTRHAVPASGNRLVAGRPARGDVRGPCGCPPSARRRHDVAVGVRADVSGVDRPARCLPRVILTGLLLLGCALMDPVLPFAETEVRSHGLDIVIALDLSSSMEEQMEAPARSSPEPDDASEAPPTQGRDQDVRRPARRRPHRSRGLLRQRVRGEPADVRPQVPLRYIDMVDNQILRGEGMTAIGEGLALSTTCWPGRR